MNVIRLESVSKTFGLGNGATQALRGVSLVVPKGEFLIIMGPSGSGKSTLMNIIGLLDRPDEGDYVLDNKDVERLSERQRAKIRRNHIGFIFQNFNLIGRMNIIENVSLPLLYKRTHTLKRLTRASEILEYLGIQEKEYYMPNQLSGGQLQRAAIARAMVNRPSIVLADEPTGNLDSKASRLIMTALKEIHQAGNTIIMVTHNHDLARYADRVIKMADGTIVEELTGSDITKEIRELRVEADAPVENIEEPSKPPAKQLNIRYHPDKPEEKPKKTVKKAKKSSKTTKTTKSRKPKARKKDSK